MVQLGELINLNTGKDKEVHLKIQLALERMELFLEVL